MIKTPLVERERIWYNELCAVLRAEEGTKRTYKKFVAYAYNFDQSDEPVPEKQD